MRKAYTWGWLNAEAPSGTTAGVLEYDVEPEEVEPLQSVGS
jgi:hypothetical protein